MRDGLVVEAQAAAAPPEASAEPLPDAPDEVWRSWLRELIRTRQFSARRWSWVCVGEGYFLKIPRRDCQLEPDLSATVADAEAEYRLTRQLAEQLDGMVDAPLSRIDACIVKRRLRGADLWRLARREGGTPRVQAAIAQGLILAARLHRLDPTVLSGLAAHDYAQDPYLPAPQAVHDRLRETPRTITLGGFEVRNFMQDRLDGRWVFFDPHDAVLGAPEDDVARYILSLLSVNWGRHADCRIWTRFDYRDLVETYETARGAGLDRQLLAYMFERNVARRRYEIRRSTRALPWLMRIAARAYEGLFFRQVESWLRRI